MSKKRSMALSKDELELISRKLTFDPDYTRFRSVCKSWRSAAPKRPQLPWLIVHIGPTRHWDDKKIDGFFNLYQFSFQTNKFEQIPGLTKSPLLPSCPDDLTVCIGSSRGWMALFNPTTSSVSLFNLLTKSTIDLPNLPNWDDPSFANFNLTSNLPNWEHFSFANFNLTSNPGDSLSDCFAFVCCTKRHPFCKRFLFCKIGCSGWIEMRCSHPEDITNFRFCNYRGKTYIVSGADVFVCDFGRNPSVHKIGTVSSNNTPVEETLDFEIQDSYLVELGGDLSLVLVYYECCEYCYGWYKFQVFKLEFGCQLVKFVELKSLGDKSLFLGLESDPFSLTASKYSGCKENSIYLPMISYDYDDRRIVQSLITYDFEEGKSVYVIDDSDPDFLNTSYYAWFAPSLLK